MSDGKGEGKGPPKDPFSHPNLKGLTGEQLVHQLVFNDLKYYNGSTFPDRPTLSERKYMDRRITELEIAARGGDVINDHYFGNHGDDNYNDDDNDADDADYDDNDDNDDYIDGKELGSDEDNANDMKWDRMRKPDINDHSKGTSSSSSSSSSDDDDDDEEEFLVHADSSAPASSTPAPVGKSPFLSQKIFEGAKEGYVFTTGARGTGYYLDIPKTSGKTAAAVSSSGNGDKGKAKVPAVAPTEPLKVATKKPAGDAADPLSSTLTLFVVSFALLVRASVALWGYSGMGKPPMFGDFEAQRHWLEITTSLPLTDWYRSTDDNDLLYWGLDYPPLTAYFSFFFGQVARQLVPELVEWKVSRGIETMPTKAFMRASVLLCDILITIPSLLWLVNYYYLHHNHHQEQQRQRRPSSLSTENVGINLKVLFFRLSVLLSPALLLIDHGHFQYNGVSIGFTLMSVLSILQDKDVLGSVFFCLALNYKQMTLYYALVIFVVLLRKVWMQPSFTSKLIKLAQIGLSVIATFGAMWFPFCIFFPYTTTAAAPAGGVSVGDWKDTCLPSMLAVLQRCFPFSRGIFEDKVSNLWYSLSVIYDFRGKIPVDMVVRASLALTLAMSAPILVILFKRKANFERILLGLTGGSLAFFLASFQVHEKSILMVLVPASLLTIVETGPDNSTSKSEQQGTFPRVLSWLLSTDRSFSFSLWLQVLGTWTLFPLLVKDGLRIPYFVLQLMYILFSWLVSKFKYSYRTPNGRQSGDNTASNSLLHLPRWFSYFFLPISTLGMLVLHAGEALVDPPERYPDLFPALFALYGCLNLVAAYFVIVYWLASVTTVLDEDKGVSIEAKNDSKSKKD